MKRPFRSFVFFAFWVLLTFTSKGWTEQLPPIVYLSWVEDPTSTMQIHWHTPKEEVESSIYYQKRGGESWSQKEGEAVLLKNYPLLVHKIELVDLEEDTEYFFKIGEEGYSYRFRTLPKELTREVRFVVGGDLFSRSKLFEKMNEQVADTGPDFVVLGGDIAYTVGRGFKTEKWEAERWERFFTLWKEQMIAPDGRMIPMVVVVGNHDVKRGERKGQFFYEFFTFPEENVPYRALDVGNYLSLILLDSGHSFSVDGEQREWLKRSLEAREKVPYKMAVYHVGAFPSVYPYQVGVPGMIRKEWVPLFEQYGVKVAFENHNHAYKRTYPIKGDKIDEDGVVYLGDGAWGVSPRKPVSASKRWYFAKTAQMNCFWQVDLSQESCHLQSKDNRGQLFEEIFVKPVSYIEAK